MYPAPIKRGLIGLLLAFWMAGAATAEVREADVLLRDILLLIQGDPIAVSASPAICPSDFDSGLLESDPVEWYFGKAGCQLTYPPSLSALVTSASEWDSGYLVESADDQATSLNRLLDELVQKVSAGGLGQQQRLMIHTTMWELIYGLKKAGERQGLPPSLEEAVCSGLRILESTAYKPEEAAELPDTLADLPRLAAVPGIEPIVESLISQDPGIAEVSTATELHADLLFGRFAARIFLTAEDEEDRVELVQYLEGGPARYAELRNLPLRFSGLRAILILYFNVLTPQFQILPTEQIAYWQEYWFQDRVDFEIPFGEMAQNISFRTIAYARPLSSERTLADNTPSLVYRERDQGDMARRGFIEVKPLAPRERVSSLRAHCLRCHVNQVATFDTHGNREVSFLQPFARQGREVLTPFFLQRFEPDLQEWVRSCLVASENASAEVTSIASTLWENP